MLAHSSPIDHVLVLALAGGAVVVYGVAWLRRPDAAYGRLAAWIGAVVVTLAATTPLVEGWAERTFTGHMAQHLAMIVVAAPLFVLAQPVRTLHHSPWFTHRPGARERAVSRWWHRRGAFLAPALFLGVLYLTHLTSVYEWALDNRFVHDAEHVGYVGAAIALWAAIHTAGRRGPLPRIGVALAVIAGMAMLGIVLMSASEPLVPTYLERLGTERALDDQRLAASFMWAGGMGMTLPLLLTSVWVWASAEERMVARSEALVDRAGASSTGRSRIGSSSAPPPVR
jgi:putative membrane protein